MTGDYNALERLKKDRLPVRFGARTLVRIILCLWIVALLSACLSCNRERKVDLSGKVSDWTSGASLITARVSAFTSRDTFRTLVNPSGVYRLSELPAGLRGIALGGEEIPSSLAR
jgi:hypothetical protein